MENRIISNTVAINNANVKIVAEKEFIPQYATETSAGADLKAHVEYSICVSPGARVVVPTGIKIQLPPMLCALVTPRSGLAVKKGITITNSPGLIDSDYRGEIGVVIQNTGDSPFIIDPGDRIAQLLIVPWFHASWDEVSELGDTDRGEGGFGHTGVKQ